MSLNVGIEGSAYNLPANAVADPSTVTAATFDQGTAEPGKASLLKLFIDTSGGSVNLSTLPTPSSLGISGGATLIAVNNDGTNSLLFTDPVTTRVQSYANRIDESVTLFVDGVNNSWQFAH